jgi:hypothetical protein
MKRIAIGVFLFALAAGICWYFGVFEAPRGEVSGKATLDVKLVPLDGLVSIGLVSILSSVDGQIRHGRINREGRYTITKIPPGHAQVAVFFLGERSNITSSESLARRRFFARYDKYRDINTSGLTLEVKPGPQTYDIELKPDPELLPEWRIQSAWSYRDRLGIVAVLKDGSYRETRRFSWPWSGPLSFTLMLTRLLMA